jgi:hypothetical protein
MSYDPKPASSAGPQKRQVSCDDAEPGGQGSSGHDGTGDWQMGPMDDQLGLIAIRIGAWNHFKHPGQVPAAGEHDAGAIKAAHGVIEVIDELIRGLHALRGQLVSEIREDEDAHMLKADALLAKYRQEREAAARREHAEQDSDG